MVTRLRQAANAQGQVQDDPSGDKEETRDRRETGGFVANSLLVNDELADDTDQTSDGVKSAPYISNTNFAYPPMASMPKKQVNLYMTLTTPVFDTRNYTVNDEPFFC